jgi:hypothetical protein
VLAKDKVALTRFSVPLIPNTRLGAFLDFLELF